MRGSLRTARYRYARGFRTSVQAGAPNAAITEADTTSAASSGPTSTVAKRTSSSAYFP